MNDGVCEPLAVPIARSYPITTVQFLVTGGLVTCPWGSEVAGAPSAAYAKRQPESATNWMDTTSCQMP
ncbi:hypothetical protein N7519_008571 [Penicillium mononematosum]|uniref:uncharacterized protein n=1 Tax=Penicillium mononematosum TaxID=268346 RepID=UPI002549A34C|nr:uncharacterized protein N7519_008571 [Penicillium mononematosum]KAJ6178110.1 hypothetical protein N7519_008571 [Penicillium mononematosum]